MSVRSFHGNPPSSDVREFLLPWVLVELHIATSLVTTSRWKQTAVAEAKVVVWHNERKCRFVTKAKAGNAVSAAVKAVLFALEKPSATVSKPYVHYSDQKDVLNITWGSFVNVTFEKKVKVEVGTIGKFPDPAHAVAHAVIKAMNKYEQQKPKKKKKQNSPP